MNSAVDCTDFEMPRSGENFDPAALFDGRDLTLAQRAVYIDTMVRQDRADGRMPYHRVIGSAAGREVLVHDRDGVGVQRLLMFGSNNYLGLATHPKVRERVMRAIDQYGTGIGGPPLLNGYLRITRQLEERLAAHKQQEDAMIFSSGFSANLALPGALARRTDCIYYDEYSHASLFDGLRLGDIPAKRFPHNDVSRLEAMLAKPRSSRQDVFVAVEGVYSMDGDLAPLDRIAPLCRRYGALLVVDDAHGTGVIGAHGCGAGEHFGVASQIDVLMGTFSKALAVSGGFVCASRPLIEYLRCMSRSYVFSAALPPPTIAAVHGALDVIESEPERMQALHDNVAYALAALNALPWGFTLHTDSAILIVPTPPQMDIRRASAYLHEQGLFINPVHYPAVPRGQERLRISLMCTHTRDDIDRLADGIDGLWRQYSAGGLRVVGNC